MAKALVLYPAPANADAFQRHYYETHFPLVRRIPGLAALKVSRAPLESPAGQCPFYMIVELEFGSRAALLAAFNSPESRAAAEDLANFAPPGRIRLVYETRSLMTPVAANGA